MTGNVLRRVLAYGTVLGRGGRREGESERAALRASVGSLFKCYYEREASRQTNEVQRWVPYRSRRRWVRSSLGLGVVAAVKVSRY